MRAWSSTSRWSAPASSATSSRTWPRRWPARPASSSAGGAPLTQLEVPGATTMKFAADGPHIILDQLTRPLTPGETIIVTLLFQKSGGIGIVTLVE